MRQLAHSDYRMELLEGCVRLDPTRVQGGLHNWLGHVHIALLVPNPLICEEGLTRSLIVASGLKTLKANICGVRPTCPSCDHWSLGSLERYRQKTKTRTFCRLYMRLHKCLLMVSEIASKQHSGQNWCWQWQTPAKRRKHAYAYTLSQYGEYRCPASVKVELSLNPIRRFMRFLAGFL